MQKQKKIESYKESGTTSIGSSPTKWVENEAEAGRGQWVPQELTEQEIMNVISFHRGKKKKKQKWSEPKKSKQKNGEKMFKMEPLVERKREERYLGKRDRGEAIA